jgi:hypothetical protein
VAIVEALAQIEEDDDVNVDDDNVDDDNERYDRICAENFELVKNFPKFP